MAGAFLASAAVTEPCWRAEFEGRAYLVAPVVALVPGVLNGYLNPADEVAKYVAAWNDAPVPLGHPQRRGVNVSARSLDVIEHEVIGRFQNVVFEENRLKGELWLEIEKAERLGDEAVAVLAMLEAGEPVEVSTAYFADLEMTPGEWEGRAYEGIARNIRPDHLAVLPGAVGACSWRDGCGAPRVHDDRPQTTDDGLTADENRLLAVNGQRSDQAILSKGGDMKTVTINMELTLDEQMERVIDALFSRQGPDPEPWGVRAVFPDRVIVDTSKGLMEFPYTVTADTGEIEFGDGAEVEVIYQRVGGGSGTTTTNAQHTNKTGGCPCMDEHQETVVNVVELQEEVTPVLAPEPQAPSLPADLAEFQRLVTDLGGVQAVREMLSGLKANADEERARLLTDLTTNERCVFSADELRAMPTATLDKLAQSLRPADYSGRGGPRTHQESDEWAVLAAPEVK